MADDTQNTDLNPPQLSADVLDPADGGYTSRKMWFAIGTSVAVILGGVFFAFIPGFRDGYSTLVEGLLAVLGVYSGGNVANKMVVSKHIAMMTATKIQAAMNNGKHD